MKRIDSMKSYALISALGIALASALALILSPSGRADDHWDPPHQAFVIHATTPQGIPQASGAPVKVSGTITVLGKLPHKDDDSCGDDDHPCKPLGLLDLLKAEGVAIHASFPDQTQDVTAAVSLQQVGTNQIQFSYASNILSRDDLNVFALQVTHVDEDLAELLRVQSKIDRRAATLSDLIKQLTSQGVSASDLAELVALRDRLLAISARIAQFLAQKPQLMAEADLPIQVDNIVARGGLDSSLQHRFRAEIRADLGTAIQGEKTVIHAKITRLGIPEEPGDDDAEDQFTAAFYWQGKLLKQLAPQSIPEGSGVSFDFQTAKLLPTDLNDFEAKLTKVQTEEDDDEPVRPVADLTYHLPVAVDNTPPQILAGAMPDARHSCVYTMQPVSMTIQDTFGLVDPTTVAATLKGTLNDGTLVGGDVTSQLVIASPDQGQTYTVRDNGALNPAKEGVYTFTTSSADLAGNATLPNPYTTTFRVDRTAPVTTLAVADSVYTNKPYTNLPNLSFGVQVVDYFDFCSIQSQVTDNGNLIAQKNAANFVASAHLPDGFHQINAISQNLSDGLFGSTVGFSLIVDTIPPKLLSFSPAPNSIINVMGVPYQGTSDEPLLYAKVNGQPAKLSDDKKSFLGNFTAATEGALNLHVEIADLATNVTTSDVPIQIILHVLNGNLLSVRPDPDGQHLDIVGAPYATRPGLTVNATASYLNHGSVVANADGSFIIQMGIFQQALVSATDPSLGRTESASVAWGPASGTLLAGTIRNSLDSTPLAGVGVFILAGGNLFKATTDGSGTFQFKDKIPTGDQVLLIDPTTAAFNPGGTPMQFSRTHVAITIGVGASNVLKPIWLTPILLDGSAAQHMDGSATTVSNSKLAPGVSLSLPALAGIATFPDGTHSGAISMATIPGDRATTPAPSFASPQHVIALEPSGLTFSQPVPITVPNLNQLPAGVDVVFMSMNSLTGSWELGGAGTVTADRTAIVSKPGQGIRHFSTFMVTPLGPTVRPVGAKDKPGADTFNGAVSTGIQLPSYQSLGQPVAPSLFYRSSWAKPSVLVTNLLDLPSYSVQLNIPPQSGFQQAPYDVTLGYCYVKATKSLIGPVRQGDPVCTLDKQQYYTNVQYTVTVDATERVTPNYVTAQFSSVNLVSSPNPTFTGLPERAAVSYAMDLKDPSSGNYLPSGIYPYLSHYELHFNDIVVGTQTVHATDVLNGPEPVQTNPIQQAAVDKVFPRDLGGPVFIQNKTHSPAGRGWKIGGVQEIENPGSDRVMIEEGDGSISSYTIQNTMNTLYDASIQGGSLAKGVGLASWPLAQLSSSDATTFYQVDLSVPGSALKTIGTNAAIAGKLGGYDFYNWTSVGNTTVQNCHQDCGASSCDTVCETQVVATYTPYSACHKTSISFSMGSTPSQFLALPNGQVLGIDNQRSALFAISGGQTGFVAGDFAGVPTWGSNYYYNSPHSYADQMRAFCQVYGLNCSQDYDVAYNNGGYNSCGGAPTSSGTIPVSTVAPTVSCAQICGISGGNCHSDCSTTTVASTPINGSVSGNFSIPLNHPAAIISGLKANTVVVADSGNHVVKLFDFNSSTETVIAGNGQPQDYGDGGSATSAGVLSPKGVSYDALGNLYISTGSGLIRKVDPSGTITTFAGPTNGTQPLFADIVPANQVSLLNPNGLVVDNQNGFLYVADTGHYRVVRIDFATRTATAVAGNGNPGDSTNAQPALQGGLNGPTVLGLDPQNNLLIADTGNQKIKQVIFQNASAGILAFVSSNFPLDHTRLIRNADGTWTRTYRDGKRVVFDSTGKEIFTQDRLGRKTGFGYDSQGRLTSMTDPAGRSVLYAYSGTFLSSITDPAGRTSRLNYDGAGDLVAVTFPDGTSKSYAYDPAGLMLSETDARGGMTQYQYNQWSRLARVTRADGTAITVNDSGSATAANNFTGGASGTLQSFGTDSGQVSDAVTDTKGQSVRFIKGFDGSITTIVDAGGNSSSISRNAFGQTTQVTRADGSVATYTYTGGDPNSPSFGDLLSQSDTATGITTSQTFDSFGNKLTETNGRGFTTTMQYDPVTGLLLSRTDPLNHAVRFTYTASGQPATLTNALGNVTSYSYDSSGNLSSISDPLGNTKRFVHDAAGNMLAMTNENNQSYKYTFDLFNRMITATTPKGEQFNYTYLPTGELSQVQDALGNSASFEFDPLGRLIKKTDPLGNVTARSYDSVGNLIQEIDPNGNLKQFVYDNRNKLVKKILPDNLIVLTYDSRGHLLQATNQQSQVAFNYDSLGRIISSQSSGLGNYASLPNVTLAFSFDGANNRTGLDDPTGHTSYVYDADNRLTSLTNPTGALFQIGYDAANHLSSLSRPGSSTSFALDDSGFVTSIVHSSGPITLSSFTYQRDAVGNRTSIATQQGVRQLAYDSDNQLSSASNPEASSQLTAESFAYDPIFNRIADQTGKFLYDGKSQHLIEDYNYTYVYDKNGNLISKQAKSATLFAGQVTNYLYSSENQLIGIKVYPSGLSSVPSKEIAYAYDAIGRRIAKQVIDHTAPSDPTKTFTRAYAYDDQAILLEYDGSGNLLARYTHAPGADNVLAVDVRPAGVTAGLASAAQSYLYLKDAQGSVTEVTDSRGNKLLHYVYSAFGILLGIKDAQANDVTSNPPLNTSYGFTGRELDRESGLMYYRARYYDPNTGRFLQQDPKPGALNLPITVGNSYIYVANNPLNLLDPSGQGFWDVIGDIVEAIIDIATIIVATAVAAITIPILGPFGVSLAGGLLGMGLGIGKWVGGTIAGDQAKREQGAAIFEGGEKIISTGFNFGRPDMFNFSGAYEGGYKGQMAYFGIERAGGGSGNGSCSDQYYHAFHSYYEDNNRQPLADLENPGDPNNPNPCAKYAGIANGYL